MIRVSVILATYNRADFLPRAIDSILNQTIHDIELIIVDDGSTDATRDLLINYAHKDQRVKVVNQENQGLAIARNNGVAHASGRHIAFMDSDDACAVNRLELQLEFLDKNNHYSACALSYKPSIQEYYPGIVADANYEYETYYGSAFSYRSQFKALGAHSCMTRESFIRLGGYRTQSTIIEDMDFTLRYSHFYRWATMLNMGSYFYTAPEDNPSEGLINSDLPVFIKRHAACYISEWCRINNFTDPVSQNKTLKEILSMKKNIPIKDRAIIYRSMKYFINMLSALEAFNRREAKYYLLNILSDNIFVREIIDIQFKRMRARLKTDC